MTEELNVTEELNGLRAAISSEDVQIIAHLARRLELVMEVAKLKGSSALPVMQPGQVTTVLDRAELLAEKAGVSGPFLRRLYESIIAEACRLEDEFLQTARAPRGKALILGGAGVAGGIAGTLLARAGYDCKVVDIAPPPGDAILADVRKHSDDLAAVLSTCDAVVFATPHDVTLQALYLWAPSLPPSALIIDVLSSKSSIAMAIASLDRAHEAVGINPMFGASLEPMRPPLLCVTYCEGDSSRQLVRSLRETGSDVVECADAAEHDGICARWQAMVHATVLAFGMAAQGLGEDFVTSGRVAPPPFRLLRSALARMLRAADATTYEEIQFEGAHAADARRQVASAATRLADGGRATWRRAWLDLAAAFPEPELVDAEDQFLRASRAIFERFEQA